MKKIIALFVCAFMLAGCGSTASSSSTEKVSSETKEGTQSVSSSPEQASSVSKEDAKFKVEILGHELTKDYEDKPAVLVTYSFTNNSDKATSFMVAVTTKAFQDGVELSSAIVLDKENADNSMKEIKPGATIEVQSGYVLDSETSPVEIEVTELFSFSDQLLAQQTISIA